MLILGSLLTISFYIFNCWYAIVLLFLSSFLSYSFMVYYCFCCDDSADAVIGCPKNDHCSSAIHHESQKIIKLIVRDFVYQWSCSISQDKELVSEATKILECLSLALQLRLQNIDIKQLLVSVLPLLDQYLIVLNDVGYIEGNDKIYFDVSHHACSLHINKKVHLLHPALYSVSTEKQYLQNIVDDFVLNSVPSCYSNCDVAVQFVRDTIATKVLLPLVDLICNADFLLEFVPLVLSKPSYEKLESIRYSITQENDMMQCGIHSMLLPFKCDNTFVPTVNEGIECDPVIVAPEEHWVFHGCSEDVIVVDIPSIYVHKYVRVDTKDGEHIGYIIKVF